MKNKKILLIISGVISIIVVIVLVSSITTVPTGFVGVKTRFGKVQENVIQEGLNTKVPFIEKIVKIDCKTKKIEQSTEASSKDLQTVTTSIAVNYNVNKDTANTLFREVGTDYENIIINPAMLESIKQAIAQYTAEELITKRSDVSNDIQDILTEKITDRGFAITEFNITNIDFSESFDQAIEAKAVKQQEVQTAQAELEKQTIQNQKEVSQAEKDAQVMALQNSQITENTLKLKELEIKQKMIDKWNGAYPTTMLGENITGMFDLNN